MLNLSNISTSYPSENVLIQIGHTLRYLNAPNYIEIIQSQTNISSLSPEVFHFLNANNYSPKEILFTQDQYGMSITLTDNHRQIIELLDKQLLKPKDFYQYLSPFEQSRSFIQNGTCRYLPPSGNIFEDQEAR